MDYATKVLYQSNAWYNDGLKKASIRDLTGAIVSLKKSLQYNRDNIAARNLLGLVYYGRGEVAEALREWILSKNFQSHDNIANYYIKKVKENPTELAKMNQAIKRFNQSLDYCTQGNEDMAILQLKKAIVEHPNYVKAYQLLTLLFIHTGQFSQARQSIRAAHKLDTTDTTTLHYMHELRTLRKEQNVKIKSQESKAKHTVTYTVGNDTIIQPTTNRLMMNTRLHTVANIGIGILVGVALMWFLIMPALNTSTQNKNDKRIVEFSDEIASQKAQINALKKELDTYRSSEEESTDTEATADEVKESYETVINMYNNLNSGDMSYSAMADELLNVKADALGTLGRQQFDTLTATIYPDVCSDLYTEASECYSAGNYDTAITDLEKVNKMDGDYNNGAAVLLLAQCYEKNGKTDEANKLYQQILEDFPSTEAASSAQSALDAQSGKTTDDTSDSTDAGTSTDAAGSTDTTGTTDTTGLVDTTGTTDAGNGAAYGMDPTGGMAGTGGAVQ